VCPNDGNKSELKRKKKAKRRSGGKRLKKNKGWGVYHKTFGHAWNVRKGLRFFWKGASGKNSPILFENDRTGRRFRLSQKEKEGNIPF